MRSRILLNTGSGLLGVSGISSDMRELIAVYKDNPRARLAIDVFCYRARKYLGAYLAALQGADAVVFSGGIGEHLPFIRKEICGGMEWCGLLLDEGQKRFSYRNRRAHFHSRSANSSFCNSQR